MTYGSYGKSERKSRRAGFVDAAPRRASQDVGKQRPMTARSARYRSRSASGNHLDLNNSTQWQTITKSLAIPETGETR